MTQQPRKPRSSNRLDLKKRPAAPPFARGARKSAILGTPGAYNVAMPDPLLQEIQSYIGFGSEDAARIRQLSNFVVPQIPQIVRRFYDVLMRHPEARAVFSEGEVQVARQKELLASWLRDVFQAEVNDEYFRARFRIGATHVRVGLPPRYMLLGMELIWQSINDVLAAVSMPDRNDRLSSLHKLLMLDLAVMLQSFQLSDTERVRLAERDALQAKLVRAEHLAEIGQLAASLAHEIKNPLAGISGAIQIIGEAMPPNDPHRDIVREILVQIGRLDSTVRDLLLYARPSRPVLREIKLDEIIQRVLTLLREEPDIRRVGVEYESSNGDGVLHADEVQLEQLLINLILNAAHASGLGSPVRVSFQSDDFWTRLSVQDRGHGMPPDVLTKALEPFFTTKAKGTGLGLAICRRIAESHGGTIRIDSAQGQGTTVWVDLPRGMAVE